MRMRAIQRYLVPILVAILVLSVIVSIRCLSRKVLSEYLDEMLPLCEYYTGAMAKVSGKGMSEISIEAQAEWLTYWRRYLVMLRANMETIEPPEQADYFHWSALRSIDRAIVGVSRLTDAYEDAAASYSDKPDLEKLRSGSIDIDAALMLWRQASTELDKLVEMAKHQGKHQ